MMRIKLFVLSALLSFADPAAATPDGLDYMLGKWNATTTFYAEGAWGEPVESRAVVDTHMGGAFIKLSMTVPFPGAAFEFEFFLSYDKFNQVYRLAFLDDLNGYLDIYTGQMQDGILKVDNRNTGTAFPDGKGGHVVGALEFKPTTGGGFSLFAQTGSHASAELQPYMRVEFKVVAN